MPSRSRRRRRRRRRQPDSANVEAEDDDALMRRLYYDPRQVGAYGGLERFYRRVKALRPAVRRERVAEWLSGQDAYTLHRPARLRFQRRPTIVGGSGQQLQADLMDTRSHARANDGVNFVLTAVDCFSRKGWAVPVRSKSGENVAEALEKVFGEQSFDRLQTDKGKEFYNARVGAALERYGVDHFSSENDTIKASLVERFNRTLRTRLHRYMTAKRTDRFVDALPRLVEAYNETPHASTGVAPNDVGADNQALVFDRLYESDNNPLVERTVKNRRAPTPVTRGTAVRLSKTLGVFERGYTDQWTREVFRVVDVLDDAWPTVYRVTDLDDKPIAGTIYRHELQPVQMPETFLIDRVLRTRRRNGKKQFFVKWRGYPDSFNSWVNEEDME
jgi:hypothetical protein